MGTSEWGRDVPETRKMDDIFCFYDKEGHGHAFPFPLSQKYEVFAFCNVGRRWTFMSRKHSKCFWKELSVILGKR